jgi:hypothetical protein
MMTDRTRRTLGRLKVALAALSLVAVALAQGEGVNLADLANGVDNLALVALIAGAVAWYRATPLGKRIDGVLTVALFAMVAGAVLTVALQAVGLLAWQPFADVLGRWWGAAAAGIVAAVEAVFGVSITKYAAGLFQRGQDGKVALQPGAVVGLLPSQPAAPAGPLSSPVAFVLDTAERILGRTPVGATLTALLPLIQQYAQHPAVLTDDLRATIQGQVLKALQSLDPGAGQDLV